MAEQAVQMSSRAGELGLSCVQATWVEKDQTIIQAWVGPKKTNRYPVYLLTGEMTWGTNEELKAMLRKDATVAQSKLRIVRAPQCVLVLILAIFGDRAEALPSSQQWMKALSFGSLELYAQVFCRSCGKERRVVLS